MRQYCFATLHSSIKYLWHFPGFLAITMGNIIGSPLLQPPFNEIPINKMLQFMAKSGLRALQWHRPAGQSSTPRPSPRLTQLRGRLSRPLTGPPWLTWGPLSRASAWPTRPTSSSSRRARPSTRPVCSLRIHSGPCVDLSRAARDVQEWS